MFWQRRLPHWVPDGATVFLTWRLAGTLPQPAPPLLLPDMSLGHAFVHQDRELDRTPSGPRWLRDPQIASLFVEALLHGARVRQDYDLFAWVVMPNHVHIVLQPNHELPKIVRWLKTATAVRANRLLRRDGTAFWQREYYDHWIRSDDEWNAIVSYVEQNPVSAGLAACPTDWPWSSAAGPAGGKTAGATLLHPK